MMVCSPHVASADIFASFAMTVINSAEPVLQMDILKMCLVVNHASTCVYPVLASRKWHETDLGILPFI